jgi:hypothetical protein
MSYFFVSISGDKREDKPLGGWALPIRQKNPMIFPSALQTTARVE